MGLDGPVDWSQPVVVLRRYDPDNPSDVYSPLNTKAEGFAPVTRGFRVEGMVLEYRPGDPPRFHVRARTQDPDKAREYYEELLFPRRDPDEPPPSLRRGRRERS
jgi:hypothetical protein